MPHDEAPTLKPVISDLLRLPSGPVDLSDLDTDDDPGFPGDGKKAAPDEMLKIDEVLDELQERMFAMGRAGLPDAPSVLLVLQGMDTAGKGGVIRHAVGLVDPQGVNVASFKRPTEEELSHDFLWRIRKELPEPGMITIFDRSHYEDVLVQRVESLAPPEEIERRYQAINDFEAEISARGTLVIKCFLHVSYEEQGERLMARLERPDKYWKYNPGDLDSRAQWEEYREAYAIALERCHTDVAPWYVVPADKKWYRNWAVARLLGERMSELGLRWPDADFDVEEQKKKLRASM